METTEELRGIPDRNGNQQDALGVVSRESEARRVIEFYDAGQKAARTNLLTAEKYALHIDGEGDGFLADLFYGSRVVQPPAFPGQTRISENALRPVVDNAVAYHTTMPFRFAVEASSDRKAKQRAAIDSALVNHMARKFRWNRAAAQAMYIAMPAGHCPLHAFWRDDLSSEPYEPVGMGAPSGGAPGSIRRGVTDVMVGDPWATFYNNGARRDSCHGAVYARSLPLEIVKAAFAHVPGVSAMQGSTKEPSASRFQTMSRRWMMAGLGTHGQAALTAGGKHDPLVGLVAREIAPGIQSAWPRGRTTLVALPDDATADMDGQGSRRRAILLHDGPLPAGRFSFVNIYSHQRFDDIRGKPFVADIDDQYTLLNQLLMYRTEYIRRNVKPAFAHSGAEMVVEDTAIFEDNAQMEFDPGSAPPQFLQYRIDGATLEAAISDARAAVYTIGGYQAASRGESRAGDSGAKVVALQRADDTVHGPTNQRFQEDIEDYAVLNHALFVEFGDIPWLIEAVGGDLSHMVEPWIDRGMVSQEPPIVRLVSGFGATLENKAQQMLQFVGTRGADGEPLLTTAAFQKNYPDASMYADVEDVRDVRTRRAKSVNARIRRLAEDIEGQMGPQLALQPQVIAMAFRAIEEEFPPLPDDDPVAHYDGLSAIIQDLQESALAREIARYRQSTYYVWLQMLGLVPPSPVPPADIRTLLGMPPVLPNNVPPVGAPAPQGAGAEDGGSTSSPQQGQVPGPVDPGGTVGAEAIRPQPGEIAGLTKQAMTGGR